MKRLLFTTYLVVATLTSILAMSSGLCAQMPHRPKGLEQGVKGSEESIKHLEGTVEVKFKIGLDGKVEILNISATNSQLADYVIKKMSKIKLDKSDSKAGQIINYRFVFKKQA